MARSKCPEKCQPKTRGESDSTFVTFETSIGVSMEQNEIRIPKASWPQKTLHATSTRNKTLKPGRKKILMNVSLE